MAKRKLVWNDKIKRNIPEGWKIENVSNNELFSIISSGVNRFSQKRYFATADVNGDEIGEGSNVFYETRESRANMELCENSVWFAKMKNSNKHLFLNAEMKEFIESSILSTGFYGLKCNFMSFEYVSSYISAPIFEVAKDKLSHGATQQSINDEDLKNISILVPDKETLLNYHQITKGLYSTISNNIIESRKLIALRDFLLPLLMNGQAAID